MQHRSFGLTLLTCSLILACTTLTTTPTPTNESEPTSSPPPASTIVPAQTPFKIADMAQRLNELGGKPCEGKVGFTCVTLKVPLDHFDHSNTDTAVFKACDASPDCSKGLEDGSQAAYDELVQKLADAPIEYEYPLSSGKKAKRSFTLNMFDFTTYFQLYSLAGRTDLMRVLADFKAGDMLPLVRLFYEDASIDGRSGKYQGDPNFSDTMYYIVWCSDDAYYSGTPEERSTRLMEEGQKLNGLIPRLDLDVLLLGLTCAFWPSAPTSPTIREPLRAEGLPTFVLNATLDPATPFHEGKTVYEHLDNGYHIYVEGGVHSIYGRGYSCPDQYIEDFLVDGTLPAQREIICDWGEAIIAP